MKIMIITMKRIITTTTTTTIIIIIIKILMVILMVKMSGEIDRKIKTKQLVSSQATTFGGAFKCLLQGRPLVAWGGFVVVVAAAVGLVS